MSNTTNILKMAERIERDESALRAAVPEVPEGWRDAYTAFRGAFDTPLARRKDDSEFANDARQRLRNFNDAMLAAPQQAPQAAPKEWRDAVQEFVDRCEIGEVRSIKTYSKFKALLAAADSAEN